MNFLTRYRGEAGSFTVELCHAQTELTGLAVTAMAKRNTVSFNIFCAPPGTGITNQFKKKNMACHKSAMLIMIKSTD